ncbi:CheR family methyltransferase [Halegenticoccus tardaugens]|uniref:CheR family methyltransferase n=1 Tax=Halegenticoccus tardaugens TaxID=2071624 RepID=UPI00100A4ECC|nr:protein-glutamate O-methyltransferase CheR [Halegenticoccus tardaugens]
MNGRNARDGDEPDPGFRRVVRHVEDAVDFEPSYYNEAYLARRITARMRRRRVESYDEYLDLLRGDEAERAELLDALTINVTNFFRNPAMWEALREPLRALAAESRRVRAWSAPCADGREPYSLAMLARDDPEIDAERIEITATDIDEDALAAARRGAYETTRTTDVGSELSPLSEPERYVERDGNRYEIRERVKRMVRFERHDLIRDGPKGGFDLLMCRNLLIYIDAAYKLPIFETIAASLRPGGHLVVGMTESIPRECRDAFEPVEKRRRIYRRV